MNTVSLTIPFPFIVPPAHFRVRYRDVNNPSVWIAVPDQTNLPFNVVVATPGQYEFGISYVDNDGEVCAEVLYPFTVVDVCACITVSGPTVKRDLPGGPAYINIPYTGSVTALCGVIVKHMPNGLPPDLTTKASVRINPVPLSPIKVPVQGLVAQDIEVWTDCCDGNVQKCFEGTIPADPEPASGCVAITTSNTSVQIVQSVSTGQYHIRVTFPGPSIPSLCTLMKINGAQLRLDKRGGMDMFTYALFPGFFYPFGSGIQTQQPINPNTAPDLLGIRYNVNMLDCCGNITYFPDVLFQGLQIP